MIKKYEITWLDENGYIHVLNHITTDKPSNALFNEIASCLYYIRPSSKDLRGCRTISTNG